MKKIWTGILLGAWTMGLALAAPQQKRFQVSLNGSWASISEYGSVQDYREGANDFPVVPKHTASSVGGSFRYLFGPRFGIEAAGAYYPKSIVTLTDPSDGDTIEMATAAHMEMTANIIFFVVRNDTLGVYLVLGSGLDKISPKQERGFSLNMWDVQLITPQKTTDPLVLAGIGLESDLSANFGVRGDFRYRVLLASPDRIRSTSFSLGLFLRF